MHFLIYYYLLIITFPKVGNNFKVHMSDYDVAMDYVN
jgi:hypothetical protein